jgi:hypothetical protein
MGIYRIIKVGLGYPRIRLGHWLSLEIKHASLKHPVAHFRKEEVRNWVIASTYCYSLRYRLESWWLLMKEWIRPWPNQKKKSSGERAFFSENKQAIWYCWEGH